ncbi:MAG TPA: hypothetical protein VID28_21730 [Methylomirabilota bacterium]|jgi:hypothetical protein
MRTYVHVKGGRLDEVATLRVTARQLAARLEQLAMTVMGSLRPDALNLYAGEALRVDGE